jgi:hypothetical protein
MRPPVGTKSLFAPFAKGGWGILESTSPEDTTCYATAVAIHQAQNVTFSVRTPTWRSILRAAAHRTLTSSNFTVKVSRTM